MSSLLGYAVYHSTGSKNEEVLKDWDKDLNAGVAGRDLYNFIRNSARKGVN